MHKALSADRSLLSRGPRACWDPVFCGVEEVASYVKRLRSSLYGVRVPQGCRDGFRCVILLAIMAAATYWNPNPCAVNVQWLHFISIGIEYVDP